MAMKSTLGLAGDLGASSAVTLGVKRRGIAKLKNTSPLEPIRCLSIVNLLSADLCVCAALSRMPNALCPGNSEPHGSIGPVLPDAQSCDPVIYARSINQPGLDAGVPCSLQETDQVFHIGVKSRIARTAPKEDPGIARRARPCQVQQRNQSMPDIGVVSQPIIGADIRLPERPESGWLRPQAHHIM